MRILIVHNRYLLRGGEDVVFEAERSLLAQMGHDIETVVFDNASIEQRNRILVGIDTLWSVSSAQRIRRAIAAHRPHLMHVHNFFPVASPSIYAEARRANVRVLQTLHNYRLLCLSADFFRDGHICEDCLHTALPLSGIRHACYRDDAAASLTSAAMLSVHRARGTWNRDVDLFLALGEFGRRKFIEGGLPPGRIAVKPNFLMHDPGPAEYPAKGPHTTPDSGYILYAGRLAENKGIPLLLDAWRTLSTPNKRLVIMGEGPLAQLVSSAAATDPTIAYLGQRSGHEVASAMAAASALVFPSVAYETQGLSMVEALARGTPTVAFNVGGRSEIVRPNQTGWLLEPTAAALAAQLQTILTHPCEAARLRTSARQFFLTHFTAEQNIAAFNRIFARLRIAEDPPNSLDAHYSSLNTPHTTSEPLAARAAARTAINPSAS
jgi:glycosyltransferase involved in cell wall biosynthesis